MIQIRGTRFGVVEVDGKSLIRFPNGLVGFPREDTFVLLERGVGHVVGYLQAVRTAELAFPVVDGALFGSEYPHPPVVELAQGAGIPTKDLALLVIVAANPVLRRLEANLLAPLVIDADSRTGAQVVLDHRRYSACTSLAAQPPTEQQTPEAIAAAVRDSVRQLRAVEATEPANDLRRAASM